MSIYNKIKQIRKHKNFDDVLPYTYIIIHKKTRMKYHGVRWANVSNNRTPNEDLGFHYFTSSPNVKPYFKENKENYDFKIKWTFDSIEDAVFYENWINGKLVSLSDWTNQWTISATILSKDSREKISKTSKDRWENEEYRHKMSIKRKAICNTKKFKDNLIWHHKYNPNMYVPSFKGKTHKEETKQYMSDLMNSDAHPTRGKKLPKSHGENVSKGNKGKPKSKTHSENIAKANKGKKHKKVKCDICGREFGYRHINRHKLASHS